MNEYVWGIGGMTLRRGKKKYSDKTLSQHHFAHI
jgi:hypothetical protein